MTAVDLRAVRPGEVLTRTPRLELRRFQATDGDGLHAVLSRPEAVRFEPYGTLDRDECERVALERSLDARFWAVCRRQDGRLVGTLYLAPVEPSAWRTYELGYVFHPDHWGRGYATESAAALLDRVFGEGRAHRVLARCDPRNGASGALLTRLGMRHEATHLRAASFTDDASDAPVWHDVQVYAVLEEEWASRESRATGDAGVVVQVDDTG